MAPPWLLNQPPRPPAARGRAHGRAVQRRWLDGRVDRFESVLAAARAIGRDRVVIYRLLEEGGTDYAGCTWHADGSD